MSAHHPSCLQVPPCAALQPKQMPYASMLLGLARGRATALHSKRQKSALFTGKACQHYGTGCVAPTFLNSPDAQA